jgi:hypothetical protein
MTQLLLKPLALGLKGNLGKFSLKEIAKLVTKNELFILKRKISLFRED